MVVPDNLQTRVSKANGDERLEIACRWAQEHLNILITESTGDGKTWLARAFAQKACREGYTSQYIMLTRLLRELMVAKGDGRHPKLLASLAKVDVLILDLCAVNSYVELAQKPRSI